MEQKGMTFDHDFDPLPSFFRREEKRRMKKQKS